MFNSKFGAFNGNSWEELCQQIFKRRYQSEDYQPMPASPGDFGIEGFTLKTGLAFQCYCPNRHYGRSELYEKQRDKITADLRKLKTYKSEILKRLGEAKISRWVFVTPEFDKNDLIGHARTKEMEVRGWELPFIAEDFSVLVFDGDNFIVEINEIRSAVGEALIFDDVAPAISHLAGESEEYESNVRRKCEARLADKKTSANYKKHVETLQQSTLESFLSADGYFRRMEASAPVVYVRLVRLINEFERYVVDMSLTWNASANALTETVRDLLEKRIVAELGPEFDQTGASKVARLMVARWLAICELDYDE